MITEKLRDFYGRDADASISPILKNNGKRYEGVSIVFKEDDRRICPVICLDHLYQDYCSGGKTLDKCISEIVELRERYEADDELGDFASGLLSWEDVKDRIYPALISAAENEELLQGLVSRQFLDMAVIYMVKGEVGEDGCGCVKITVSLLQQYGISEKELHEQAVANLESKEYCFQSMDDVLVSLILDVKMGRKPVRSGDELEAGRLYILSNPQRMWGAAGLLNRKFLQEKLGNRSCFILPSSIHETIFMPIVDHMCVEELSRMVREVNETQVEVSERLSDHCYIWDGENGVVRMCA